MVLAANQNYSMRRHSLVFGSSPPIIRSHSKSSLVSFFNYKNTKHKENKLSTVSLGSEMEKKDLVGNHV
jgi:hypothetical protein